MTEHDMQASIIAECDLRANQDARFGLIMAIPNGQYRKGQRMEPGLRAGVPDLFLPVAARECHGLFIELKAGSNKETKRQIWWIDRLKEQGYAATVVWDAQMAINLIAWYLGDAPKGHPPAPAPGAAAQAGVAP